MVHSEFTLFCRLMSLDAGLLRMLRAMRFISHSLRSSLALDDVARCNPMNSECAILSWKIAHSCRRTNYTHVRATHGQQWFSKSLRRAVPHRTWAILQQSQVVLQLWAVFWITPSLWRPLDAVFPYWWQPLSGNQNGRSSWVRCTSCTQLPSSKKKKKKAWFRIY